MNLEQNWKTIGCYSLGRSKVSAGGLSSQAWLYVNKLIESREKVFSSERNMLLKSISDMRHTTEEFVSAVGKLAFETDMALARVQERNEKNRELLNLRNKIEEIAKTLGVETQDPIGMKLEGELLDQIDVVKNIHQVGVRGHVVGETLTPIVSYKGRVVHVGEVIGWFGDEGDPIHKAHEPVE